jgi:phosphoglycerate dehydrogenase-like enzyme
MARDPNPTLLLAGRMCMPWVDLVQEKITTEWEVLTWSEDEPFSLFEERAPRADAIVGGRIEGTWPAVPKLRLYQLPFTGLHWLAPEDVPAGCVVCNTYGHETAIAEHVLTAMLEAENGLAKRSERFRTRGWANRIQGLGPNHGELHGKTVGIVGYGRIGSEVSARAKAFGMTVIGVSRTAKPAPDLAWFGTMDELDPLLERSDFVVITLPLADETRGLIDAGRFARMKSSAFLINVGRGPVIDEAALYAALSAKRIEGAAIDVWYQYPSDHSRYQWPSRFPLEKLDNIVMTPHSSGSTDATRHRRWSFVAGNLDRFARGEKLDNVCFEGTATS